MTTEQLRLLSLGQSIQNQAVQPQQVVVLNQPTGQDGSCLPCDENSCEVLPTQAVAFDNATFSRTTASKFRWNIDRTASIVAETQHLTFMSNRGPENFEDYPRMKPGFLPAFGYFSNTPGVDIDPGAGVSLLISYAPDGSTINGNPGGPVVSEVNKILSGGWVISRLIIRFDSTVVANAALNNTIVTLGHLPVDGNQTLITTTVYDPFCDYCTTTNASDFVTHAYSFNGPVTFRDFVDIEIPNDAVFTLEVCAGLINLPNTMASPASNQWL